MEKVSQAGLAPWQVELTLKSLLRDLCAGCRVGELAHRCGLSRSYFTRAFRISVGSPPHRWLMRQRVRRASEMMEGTQESISTIALSCGFADQSHLTRMFRATVGLSPAAWRRQRRAGVMPPVSF